jgi:hypothetical protein
MKSNLEGSEFNASESILYSVKEMNGHYNGN